MRKTKTSKQKGVLAASILLAGVIAAGGTFAWFTSQDEVVNQLSASNNYGVSITESFTPPSGWVPGQEVEKKVGAVNTGNIDTFVRLGISNTMELTTLTTSDEIPAAGSDTVYVKLSSDEVAALQAGGVLAGAWSYDSVASQRNEIINIGAVGTDFAASDAGLYIFRRSLSDGDAGRTYEYAGYYYDGTDMYALASIDDASDKIDSEGYFSEVPAVKYQAAETTLVTPTLEYVDATADTAAYIRATYDPDNTTAGATDVNEDNNIIINIKLTEYADGLTGTPDTWTKDTNADAMEFYYKKILAAGASSNDLVASVELDKDVKNDAYYSFDYNLAIRLDSIQVSPDDDKTTAVNAQADWMNAIVDEDGNVEWAWHKAN